MVEDAVRIGCILDETVYIGGGFQQNLSMILALRGLRKHELIVLTSRADNAERIRKAGVACEVYRFGKMRRLLTKLLSQSDRLKRIFYRLPRRVRTLCGPFDEVLDFYDVDLAVCFFLSWVPQFLFNRPFITVVYDLCHREHGEFPEVSDKIEFEKRERIFRAEVPRAIAVLISSSWLAQKLQLYYGIDKERLIELPLFPASHSRVRATAEEVHRVRLRYSLINDYVFYPAQYWPHKNHVYVLEAMRILVDTWGRRIEIVFCGSDFGNAEHIRRTAARLGIADRVHMLGFVDAEDMSALYTGAQSLVMPTYFGPTNMPPIEAAAIGCPVIYSDLPEFRAQFGEAVLYCDLREPASLAEKIRTLAEQPEVAEGLKAAAVRVSEKTQDEAAFGDAIQRVVDEYEYVRRRWRDC